MCIKDDSFIWALVGSLIFHRRSRLERSVQQSPGRVSDGPMDLYWTVTWSHQHHGLRLFPLFYQRWWLQTYLTACLFFTYKNTSVIHTNVWSQVKGVTSCRWEPVKRVIIVAQTNRSNFILLSCKLPEERNLKLLVLIAVIHLSLQSSIYSRD